MENKDIILIIFFILILYLLFCDNRKNKEIKELKENFAATSQAATSQAASTSVTTNPDDEEIKNKIDKYLSERKEIPITESIKNLGIIAKKLQDGQFLKFPGDFVIDGDLKVTGSIRADKGLQTKGDIKLEKNKKIAWMGENYGGSIGVEMTGSFDSDNGNKDLHITARIKTEYGVLSKGNIYLQKNKFLGWMENNYGDNIGSYIEGKDNGQIYINVDSINAPDSSKEKQWVNIGKTWVNGDSVFKKNLKVEDKILTYKNLYIATDGDKDLWNMNSYLDVPFSCDVFGKGDSDYKNHFCSTAQ